MRMDAAAVPISGFAVQAQFRRRFTDIDEVPMGIAIISTSQGLMTDRQANAKSVGGEVLAYVW